MSALTFVTQAKRLPIFKETVFSGTSAPTLHLFVLDGVRLPASFFDLDSVGLQRLQEQVAIFHLTNTMLALEIGHLLPA